MAAPQNRVPVRVARGTKGNLDAALALASLQEGELTYAKDENSLYIVEAGVLIKASYSPTNIFIDDLSDVDTSTAPPTNGQLLAWNQTNNKWQPQNTDSRIIQVVQTVKTDTFSGASNGTALAVTGMSATITPNSVSNKILILAQISYAQTASTYGSWFRRGATDIGRGDAAGSRQRVTMGNSLVADLNQIHTYVYSYLDSPTTNLPVTYQYYVINDTAGLFYLNRSVTDSDSATGKRAISTITLMEVAS
jgi:hypothetical protein